MELQDALSISLYSQLFEDAVANECIALCPGMNGSFAKERRKNVFYWYWSGRDLAGNSRKIYIGVDDQKTSELIERLENRKSKAVQTVSSMSKTAAAYLSAGGQTSERSHFKIIAYLAQQQLFRKGVLLIGSHAYISICNALCIRSSKEYTRTNDIDFPDHRAFH